MDNVRKPIQIILRYPEGQEVPLECTDMTLSQEIGMDFTQINGKTFIRPNDNYRFMIKGWSGCKSYEDFKTDAKPRDKAGKD
jgi:hypothetical protein